jgi:hypothetical protein
VVVEVVADAEVVGVDLQRNLKWKLKRTNQPTKMTQI